MGFNDKEAEQLLVDTGRRCCICGLLHDVSVHHIVPQEDGGSDEIENGIPLCPNCHNVVHGHSQHASGTTTRKYTHTELRRHKQRTILQVSGKLAESVKIWSLPHLRNPHFTGREEILAGLDEMLLSGKTAAVTQAITGLGGVGKTQLAVEYAYRHSERYEIVWWMRAEESTTLKADYASLAKELELPESDVADLGIVCGAVRRSLEQRNGWLLVFDNADKPDDLLEYIPHGGKGHIIVTSRNSNWESVAGKLPIERFTRDESVAFLIKRIGKEDEEAAGKLAEALGDLPLALAQAAAYITEKRKSIAEYLGLFEKRRSELLKRGKAFVNYPDTVATTWEMSFQTLEAECPAAADLLNLCAFFAPDDIPLDVICEHSEMLPEQLIRAMADELEFDDVIEALGRYSLADVSKGLLSVHRLVQAVMRDRLGEDKLKAWVKSAVRLMSEAFPFELYEVDTWEPSLLLVPHALAAIVCADRLGVTGDIECRLLSNVGACLHNRGDFGPAVVVFKRAIALGEQIYGRDHLNVASIANELGRVLQDQGDLTGAKEAYERALAISGTTNEKEKSHKVVCLNNLGLVMYYMGDLVGAKRVLEHALQFGRGACNKEDSDMAASVGNLGLVLSDMGDVSGAKAAFERALEIDEEEYGKDHPNVACDLSNYGHVLRQMGDLAGAKDAFERALAIGDKAYGRKHPTVARYVDDIGVIMRDMDDFIGAREAHECALGILLEFFALDHPEIVRVLENIHIVDMLTMVYELKSSGDGVEEFGDGG